MDTTSKPKLGSVEETNRLLGGQYFTPLGAQIKEFRPTGVGAINANSLSENITPFNITTPPVSGNAVAISGLTGAYNEQNKAEIDLEKRALADAEAARQKAVESRSALESAFSGISDFLSSRSAEEQKVGLSDKATLVAKYTNQLEGLDRAETNELRALDGAGLTDVQKAQNQREIQRRYAFEKADVAVLQSAANRDYETASNIVNRKIELALEPLKLKLDFQKMFYEDNKDLLNEKEKRAFDLAIRNSDNELKERQTVEKYKADLTLKAAENGSPIPSSTQAKLRNASTLDEVNQILSEDEVGSISSSVLAGLPVSIQGRIDTRAKDFSNSDITKKYNATVDSINIVNGIEPTSKNPADHQTIVYAFAKSLDPESVVREGEYATIKKYAQSAIDRFGKEISNAIAGTGFLSSDAIKNIQTTMANNLKSRKPQYDNLRGETARVINNIAGSNIADEVLIDFGGGLSDGGGSEEDQLRQAGYTEAQIKAIKEAK